MIGWKPATIFACGIHDRLAEVRVVDDDRPAALRARPACRRCRRARARGPAARRMAGVARELLEQLLARGDRRCGGRPAAEPRLEVGGLHRRDPADHPGVLRAAVLGAEEVVLAGLGRREPQRVVAAGNDVRLHAERGDEVAVDDVLGAHDQLHRPPDRHVQLVDLALPVHVLHLPHPLLADDVDLHRARRRTVEIEEDLRAPREHHHDDAERDERPEQLERERAVDGDADLVVVASAVLDGERDHEAGDEQREERRDGDHEEVDRVDLRRLRGRLLRKEWKVREHR